MKTWKPGTWLYFEGKYKPSSDFETHLYLYKSFPNYGRIVHTHSRMATSWAQAELDIPAFGTTHADYFYGSIPCTRNMRSEEIEEAYEKNTGKIIAETFFNRNIDPERVPEVIVSRHGLFSWGRTVEQALGIWPFLIDISSIPIAVIPVISL